MKFSEHSNYAGTHAFLSASNYHWINYDLEKLSRVYGNSQAARKGTELHEFAMRCIQLGIKLPRSKKTLNMFVNDAIGYRMEPEQVLFFSPNSYGTADAIQFRRDLLQIFDLKTGTIPGSVHQLEVYGALFCLEYKVAPASISYDFRIYQSDDIVAFEVDPDRIAHIMDKIIAFDRQINKMNEAS